MARSADALRRDTVNRQAEGVGARIQAPGDNAALGLAQALSNIEPTANRALQTYAANERGKAQAAAKRDSLIASGAKLGDAVREGKIEATSNPWYVQAYNTESAAVRGQSSLQQLQVDSASWPEKNDPVAFATRWREEVGKVTEGFSSKDEIAGFAPVESQFTQQALQSNTSQNVTRIVAERKQNLSMLASSALATTLQQNGGVVSANQAAAALEPARVQFLATGGSQAEWNELTVAAVTSAAYATQNSGALDLLHAPELVHGASDGGEVTYGDGPEGEAAAPLPITPIAPVEPAALVPGKRWSSTELQTVVPFGGKVTSGERSVEHNKAVGGKANSQHLRGTAIDVVFPKGTSAQEVRQHYASQGASVDVIDEGDHFHIQGARNPVVMAAPVATPAVASVQAQDTPALAAPPVENVTPSVRGPSLYDMTGVADRVEADRYRISQARENAQTERLRTMQTQAKAEGFNAYNALYSAHGTDLLNGGVSSQRIIQEAQAAGYSPQAIAEAIRMVGGDVRDNAALATARISLNGADPSTARSIMDLQVTATRDGLTPGLEDRVGSLVLNGTISGDDGARIISAGISAGRRKVEDNRQDTTYAQTQAERAEKASGKTKAYKVLRQNSVNLTGLLTTTLGKLGKTVKPSARAAIQQQVSDAAGAWLALHPEDFAGAHAQSRAKAAAILRAAQGGGQPSAPAAKPSSSTTNSRRTN